MSYSGDGSTTAFPVTWKYFAKSHVVATHRDSDGDETTWVLDTDYTLTAAGVEAGGTLTATVAPATGETLVISLDPPNTQTSSLPLGGAFPSTTVEAAADLAAQRDAKLEALFNRAIRVPKSDTQSDTELELPIDSIRAGKFLAFDSNGAPIAAAGTSADLAPVSAFVDTLLDDASGSVFLKTLLAALSAETAPATADRVLLYDASADAFDYMTIGYLLPAFADPGAICQGRLTLTSGTAVTTSDVTAATTLYFALHNGNKIALYDGTNWQVTTFSELSIAVPATTNQMYDVFVYLNSGTPTLELTAWTNDTTRATALTKQDGVFVKTGVLTRRYVGSFRTTGVSGQTEDSLAKRFVWNYYNQFERALKSATETTNSWSYSTGTFRQANSNAANQLDFVIGVSGSPVSARAVSMTSNDTTTGRNVSTGIGLDSTSANSAQIAVRASCTDTILGDSYAQYRGYPGVGRHFLAWLEMGNGTDTQTWYGDNNSPSDTQLGIIGVLWG